MVRPEWLRIMGALRRPGSLERRHLPGTHGMMARRVPISRLLPFIAVTLAFSCSTTTATPAADSGCQMTEVPGSSTDRDVLSGVAALEEGALAIGSRWLGSVGGPLAAVATRSGWTPRVIHARGVHSVEMDDVSTDGAGAWAVGAWGNQHPVALRWNGRTWIPTKVEDPGPGEDGLSGVATVSSDWVWAVGRHQVGSDFRTLVERWDGRTWRAVPSPNEGSSAMLKDIEATGPDDAWAVGWSVKEQRYRTLAQHWDGAAWRVVPTPTVDGGGDALFAGVAAISPNDVWAVGWTGLRDDLHPLVERWDGQKWSVVSLPSDVGPGAFLGVAATPDRLVMVGRSLVDGSLEPLAVLKSGGSWEKASLVAGQIADGPAWFTGVAVDPSGSIWAVGSRFPGGGKAVSFAATGCV